MQLNEGGNVWDDVDPFSKKEAEAILQRAQQVMPPGLELIPVGSAGHKASSGDMDLMVDAESVLKSFGVKDEKTARAALKQSMIDRGVVAAQTGINVHLKIPNGDKFAQVDIMLVKNAGQVSKFHQHDYSVENSPFKGVHKHILLSSIAKETRTQQFPYGLMWSGFQGLFARNPDGKKGDLISQDADEVAVILLGPGAHGDSLGSVEKILAALPQGANDPRVQHALADENWPKQNEAMSEELKRIRALAGIDEDDVVSPRFAGLQKTQHKDGSSTLDYQVGPMAIQQTTDQTGKEIRMKGSYNMGVGKFDAEREKGITSKSWTPNVPSEEDPMTQKDLYAMGNKDKEATYDRAMKQVRTKESAELRAMLEIARLR